MLPAPFRGPPRPCAGRGRRRWIVQGVADHASQLELQAAVDRLGAGEGLRRLGAPPGELVAAGTPARTGELRQRGRHRAVALLPVFLAQRELPAHVGFRDHGMLAVAHGQHVQGAARAGREARPVQEDAGAIHQPGAPAARRQAGRHAPARADGEVLPLVGPEVGGGGQHPVPVVLVGEVGAVGAAALLHLGGGGGEHALAATAEEAAPGGREPGDIHHPPPMVVVGVGERRPFPLRSAEHGPKG